jgi:hypothetical protein
MMKYDTHFQIRYQQIARHAALDGGPLGERVREDYSALEGAGGCGAGKGCLGEVRIAL